MKSVYDDFSDMILICKSRTSRERRKAERERAKGPGTVEQISAGEGGCVQPPSAGLEMAER